MKRLLSVLIIIAMLISLSGCAFIKKIFNKDSGTPSDEQQKEEKPLDVNGVSVAEYNIVCDKDGLDYNLRAAEYIQSCIYELRGYKINIVDDSEPEAKREIVVGETTRKISAELDTDTKGFQFTMLAKDGTVALEADYFVIAAAAYYFVDTYVRGAGEVDEESTQVEIPNGLTVSTPITKEAKNYILLIGDGMGVYQSLLFDYLEDESDYSDGEDAFYGYMFPSLGFARTNSYSGVTDSAAGGTALATGYKTVNGYVGLDKNQNEIKSLTELASELGKASAVMSTESRTGATPSAFSAHENNRDNTEAITVDQTQLAEKYGTVIDCNYDYYNQNSINRILEKHISETLAKVDLDEDGFFLMYEEAHIDKKSHNNEMDKTFLALIRFNQAIARFMEYAFYNPDTVVIITADHETGNLLPTEDGTLAYGSTGHTSANVPVFAWGSGTEMFNGAIVENIEISQFIAAGMGVEDFGDKTGGWRTDIYGEDNSGGVELPIIPVD